MGARHSVLCRQASGQARGWNATWPSFVNYTECGMEAHRVDAPSRDTGGSDFRLRYRSSDAAGLLDGAGQPVPAEFLLLGVLKEGHADAQVVSDGADANLRDDKIKCRRGAVLLPRNNQH